MTGLCQRIISGNSSPLDAVGPDNQQRTTDNHSECPITAP